MNQLYKVDENVILSILGYLDAISLSKSSQSSRLFRRLVLFLAPRVSTWLESQWSNQALVGRPNYRRAVNHLPLKYLYELSAPRIYVLRGFISFSYDLRTRIWTRLPDLLRDRGYFQAVVLRNELYAIGTYSVIAAGTIEKYNFLANQWSNAVPMPRKVRSVGAAVFQGFLYLMGGVDVFNEQALDSFYRFDHSRSTWILMRAALLQPRFRHAAVEYRGKLWVAGGNILISQGDAVVAWTTHSVEIYDEMSSCWRRGPDMQRRRDFFNLLVVQGRLYAVGGDVDDAGNQTLRTIEVYVDATDCWEHVTDFPNARKGFSTCAIGSKIFVFAGDSRNSDEHDDNHSLSTWDAFDIEQRQWESQWRDYRLRTMPLIDNWGQAVAMPGTTAAWQI